MLEARLEARRRDDIIVKINDKRPIARATLPIIVDRNPMQVPERSSAMIERRGVSRPESEREGKSSRER